MRKLTRIVAYLAAVLGLVACGASRGTATPTPTIAFFHTGPGPTVTPWLVVQEDPDDSSYPTLADFWEGRAEFELQVQDTGLPRGESDTIVMGNGELWSYLHASDRSAGTVDRCGQPVEFPGCTVIYKSYDGGLSFQHDAPPVCQFECDRCPCDPERTTSSNSSTHASISTARPWYWSTNTWGASCCAARTTAWPGAAPSG